MLNRYGRVQSVKILLPPAFNPNLLHLSSSSNPTSDVHNTKDHYHHQNHHNYNHHSHHHHYSQNDDATTIDDTTGSANIGSGSGSIISNSSICNSSNSSSGGNTNCSANVSNNNNNCSNNNAISNNIISNSSNCSTTKVLPTQSLSTSTPTIVTQSTSASTSCYTSNAVPAANTILACTNNCTSIQLGSVCATIAFMDIKSASKAHTAEHKFDDRLLTTEYYEPSSIPSTSGENSPASNCSSSSHQQHHQVQQSGHQLQAISNLTGLERTGLQSNAVSTPQQYSSSSTTTLPSASVNVGIVTGQSGSSSAPCRFPTPNRG